MFGSGVAGVVCDGCTVDTEAFVFDWENVHSTFDKLVIDYHVTAKHHLSHNHRTA